MNIPQFLAQKRKEYKRSQQHVSDMFGISRVTYNLIENSKTPREPYRSQIEDIFDVSVDALDRIPSTPIRRTLDDEEYQQTRHILLYILKHTAHMPNVGKTVLYKILYFCEFDRYEMTRERLTGIDFVKLPRWPAPAAFDFMIRALEKEQAVISVTANYKGYTQQRYVINTTIDDHIVDWSERNFLDSIIANIWSMNAREVSDYSHGDIPRKATKDMDLIDINLALHRQYPYSVKALEQKKQETQEAAMHSWFFEDLAHEPDLYEDYR